MGQWGSLVYPRGFGTLGPRFESALSHFMFYIKFVVDFLMHDLISEMQDLIIKIILL